ncbi:MAG: MazG-like family protein [Myxococcota bacterium]|nr:MazG-like family protein [Myxococcota bacterium]
MSSDGAGSGELRELGELVAAFVRERDWERFHSPKNLAAAIAVEAAELQEIYLWRALDDPASEKRAEIQREVADIAICLINFCNRTGIDLAEVVRSKLAEAQLKYPADRVRGRSEKYDEYPEWQDEP